MEEKKRRGRKPRETVNVTYEPHYCKECYKEIDLAEYVKYGHLCKACYEFKQRHDEQNSQG